MTFQELPMPGELYDVTQFRIKFNMPVPEPVPAVPNFDLVYDRICHLEEELGEIKEAAEADNLVDLVDGLVDLVYVAKGIAIICGISPAAWKALWDEIHAANMRKVPGVHADRQQAYDVIKPTDWVGPDVEGILMQFGYVNQTC